MDVIRVNFLGNGPGIGQGHPGKRILLGPPAFFVQRVVKAIKRRKGAPKIAIFEVIAVPTVGSIIRQKCQYNFNKILASIGQCPTPPRFSRCTFFLAVRINFMFSRDL